MQQIQITHEFLVGRIANYVRSEQFKKFYLGNHCIIPKYEDSIRSKIPDMSDSRSDYLGIDQKREIYIIGEAKTISYNLSSKSSVIQLRNYLNDGRTKNNFHLIYAVPLSLFSQTASKLKKEIEEFKKTKLYYHVITDTDLSKTSFYET